MYYILNSNQYFFNRVFHVLDIPEMISKKPDQIDTHKWRYSQADFALFKDTDINLHNIHKQIKHIGGKAYFQDNNIKSHVLGLLLIDGLQRVKLCDVFMKGRLHRVEAIINKHLENGRDVFACQEELIDSKLEAFAQL